MFPTSTINKYLLKKYASYFFVIVAVFAGLLLISNIFDTLQKFKSSDLDALTFWKLAVLKLPHIFNQTSTLIGFISAILFLRKLSMTHEMVILLSSGMQSWRIYLVLVLTCLVLGGVVNFLVGPIGTFGLIEYRKIEKIIDGVPDSQVIVSQNGIFFYEKTKNNYRILETQSINMPEKSMSNLSLIFVDEDSNFMKRYDADKAFLEEGIIRLLNVSVIDKKDITYEDEISISTSLSLEDIKNRFSSPELIPLWNLKKTIKKLANSGINTLSYELYYYKQVFKPIIMSSLVLLGCIFLSVNNRDNMSNKLTVVMILIGIIAFFVIEISSRVLVYNNVEPFFACLLPPVIIVLLSNFAILHFQEA